MRAAVSGANQSGLLGENPIHPCKRFRLASTSAEAAAHRLLLLIRYRRLYDPALQCFIILLMRIIPLRHILDIFFFFS